MIKQILTLLAIVAILVACNNRAEVPADINVHVPETTQTINVVHTLQLSAQLEQFIRYSCTAQVDSAQPPMPEPQRSQAIDACVSTSAQNFIRDFSKLTNNNQQGVTQ